MSLALRVCAKELDTVAPIPMEDSFSLDIRLSILGYVQTTMGE